MALTQVKTSGLADDAVTGAKIADDTVAEANMANDAISLTELKAGTDGQIITWDASGNPVAVGPGNDGQVLTSTGSGSPPAFEDVPAGGATINNATENELVTVASTTSQLDAETNLVFDGTRLMVGTTASSSETWQPKVQIVGTESLGLGRASADNAGGHIHFYKSRNGTWGSKTIVQANDQIGNIIWYADDGNDYKSPAASIQGAVDGTPGTNDMPGRIVFNTTPDGSETLTERMKIDSSGNVTVSDGNLVIGTSGHGISFAATADSSASGISNDNELLDDYEEGDWDPTLPDSDGGVGSQAGWYAKIGKMVIVQFSYVCLTNSDSSGHKVAGFPFPCNGYSEMMINSEANMASNGLCLHMHINQSYGFIMNQEYDEKTYANFNNCQVWGSGTYMTNS